MTDSSWMQNLIVVPIVLPLVAGALLLLYDERRHFLKGVINLIATIALLCVAIVLLRIADAPATRVYLLGDWPAPFGIVLVLDRLSALMLVLTSVLAVAALIFALARWHKAGAHFHSLFQFLLMGIDGAFLTGDLFNLFVFFEVMLAASYGLVLHGSGAARVKAGLHYIAVNLAASLLFLIGVSLIYGVTGTLNMADLALRVPAVGDGERALLEAGAAILGIAFLVKAGLWPLCFWLLGAYPAAAAPAAAIFAVLSKIGVYVLLRLSPLLFGAASGASSGFGSAVLLVGGMATLAYGMIGVLAAPGMGRLASSSVLVSSGTLLAAIGLAEPGVTGGALFYLVSSTLTIGALFLLIELVERREGANRLFATATFADDEADDEQDDESGIAFPGTLAILGVCFGACALLLAGLPPLSGFVAKLALLAALFTAAGASGASGLSPAGWTYAALLILSGLAALLAMSRIGIRAFWAPSEAPVPAVLVVEIVPVVLLLLLTLDLTVQGGPVMRYMTETAQAVHAPARYVDSVLSAPRVTLRGAGDAR